MNEQKSSLFGWLWRWSHEWFWWWLASLNLGCALGMLMIGYYWIAALDVFGMLFCAPYTVMKIPRFRALMTRVSAAVRKWLDSPEAN